MCIGGMIQGLGAVPDLINQSNMWQLKDRESQANIRIAEQAQSDAYNRGAKAAGEARMKGGELVESQKAAYAASGVDPSQGTPLSVMADTRLMSEQDAQTIKNNAAREAWGFQQKAQELKTQRELNRQEHNAKLTNTALTGVSRVFGSIPFGG